MRHNVAPAKSLMAILFGCALLSGCGSSSPVLPPPVQTVASVIPSASGIPNSVATLGNLEFVSVQGSGQIFTYNFSTGTQVLVSNPYTTPCKDPSGMVIAAIAGSNIMAVVCYDTGSLLTLTVHADGSLAALGSVSGLASPYPGVVLDGTDVFVPLFGQNLVANGGVARVSIATPASPAVTGTASLASPATGGFSNPGYMAASGGNLFVAAGSEDNPATSSSSIQVVSESTMTLVGTPFRVQHSPQQIAVQGTVAYVTIFDATQLEAIDISHPASLQMLQIATIQSSANNCHAESITTSNNLAYVGCYSENMILQIDITNPSAMVMKQTLSGINAPQRLLLSGQYLLAPGSITGGPIYEINTSAWTTTQ